jgi:hypothetical protein
LTRFEAGELVPGVLELLGWEKPDVDHGRSHMNDRIRRWRQNTGARCRWLCCRADQG